MKAQIVSFHCVLKDKSGQILSSSFNQDVINQLEDESQERLRGLIAGLQNVYEGEHRQFTVPAIDAYGVHDPKLVVRLRRSELEGGDTLVVGGHVRDPLRSYRVVQAQGDMLVLDGNHPLAGHDLTFDIKVVSARDACEEDYEEEGVVPFFAAPSQYLH